MSVFNPDIPLPEEAAAGGQQPETAPDAGSIDPRYVGMGLSMRVIGELGMWTAIGALTIHLPLFAEMGGLDFASTPIQALAGLGALRGLSHAWAGHRLMAAGTAGLRWQWPYRIVALAQTALLVWALAGVGPQFLAAATVFSLGWPLLSWALLARTRRTPAPAPTSARQGVERGLGVVGPMMLLVGLGALTAGLGLLVAGVLMLPSAGLIALLMIALGAALMIRPLLGMRAARQADTGGHAVTFVEKLRAYKWAVVVTTALALVPAALLLPVSGSVMPTLLIMAVFTVWPRAIFRYARTHLGGGVLVALPHRNPVGVGAGLLLVGLPMLIAALVPLADGIQPSTAVELVGGVVLAALTVAAGFSLWQRRAHALVAAFGVLVAGGLLLAGLGEIMASAEMAQALGAGGAFGGLELMANGAQTIVSAIVPLGLIWFTRPLR